MFRNGKPTSSRIPATTIQKTNSNNTKTNTTSNVGGGTSSTNSTTSPSSSSRSGNVTSKQFPTSSSGMNGGGAPKSSSYPQPSKSPTNASLNTSSSKKLDTKNVNNNSNNSSRISNVQQQQQEHYHYHNLDESTVSSSRGRNETSKIEEDDEDDDMEILSVNDQHQYLKHNKSSSNTTNGSRDNSKNNLLSSSIKSNTTVRSSRSSNRSNSSRSNNELLMSDDSIPLKLKKKVQIETPREKRETLMDPSPTVRGSRDSLHSSLNSSSTTFRDQPRAFHHSEVHEDDHDSDDNEQNNEMLDGNDDVRGESMSVSSSTNSSLHILSSVRNKRVTPKEEDEEESIASKVDVNSSISMRKPSRMAEYIKRFRNAPPTSKNERQRIEFDENNRVVMPPSQSNTTTRGGGGLTIKSKSKESAISSINYDRSPSNSPSWKKNVGSMVVEQNINSHPSLRNIHQMKESINREVMDVEESIELAKRYSSRFDFNDEEDEVDADDQILMSSQRNPFSYMDTLDFDINELNNMTDMALGSSSFKMFGGVGGTVESKLSSKLSSNFSDDEEERPISSSSSSKRPLANDSSSSIDSIIGGKEQQAHKLKVSSNSIMNSDDEDEEELDEMFRKGVLSRLQSIGLDESYLVHNIQSYDILMGDQKKKSTNRTSIEEEKTEKQVEKQVEELIEERNVKQELLPTASREQQLNNSRGGEKSSSNNNSLLLVQNNKGAPSSPPIPQQPKPQLSLSKSVLTESMDSILGKSIESVSSISSCATGDMSQCQRMIEQMVNNSNNCEEELPSEKQAKVCESIDISDDNHELFTSDYICQTLRQKIDDLKNKLLELEKKDALLK